MKSKSVQESGGGVCYYRIQPIVYLISPLISGHFFCQQVPLPVRRRSRSEKPPNARLVTESRNYDLVYTEDDRNMMNGICASIIQELVFLNSVMQIQNKETEPYKLDPFGLPSEVETSTSSKMPDWNYSEFKASEDLSLEKFLQVMSSMVNNDTQTTTSESSLKKQKILH